MRERSTDEEHRPELNSRQKAVAVIAAVVIIGVVAFLLIRLIAARNEAPITSKGGTRYVGDIEYNGKWYNYNRHLTTVLFIGVDTTGELEGSGYIGTKGQADSLFLAVCDKDTEKIQIIGISRNTMTDIEIYGEDGAFIKNERAQVNLQYAYGDGAGKSCRLTRARVSSILMGAPIDSYFAMNMDGITALVDALGGIDYTFTEDASEINAAYTEGATVHMDGDEAEHYVRYRTKDVGANEERIRRQIDFSEALIDGLKGENDIEKLLDTLDPYVVTNVDAGELEELLTYEMADEVITLPGISERNDDWDEFITDEAGVADIVMQVFYTPTEDAR